MTRVASASRGVGLILLVLLVGLTVGAFVGELLGALLPPGFWQTFLTRGPSIGLTSPATLDLRFVSLTLGLTLKVNLAAVLGLVVAALALRRL